MDLITSSQAQQRGSIAHIYKLLDQPVRREIVSILQKNQNIAFKTLSEILDLDRAALAYHLKILKNADLIENYYDNQKGSSSYSFYRLTGFSRWLLSHDMQLAIESQHYREQYEREILGQPEITTGQKQDGSSRKLLVTTENDGKTTTEQPRTEKAGPVMQDGDFKIKKDPRIKYTTYRISY